MARDRELRVSLKSTDVATSVHSRWRRELNKLEPVMVSAALAVGLHAVVFSVPVRAQGPSGVLAAPSFMRAMQVRTISAGSGATHAPSAGPVETGVSTVDAPPPGSATQAPGRDVPAGVVPNVVSPPAGHFALRVAGALGDEEFFPREALGVGPSPAAPVLIDYPISAGLAGTHTGILSLFIDETGKVVRVRVDTQTLPPEMQEAARSAFADATFTPGMVDGLPVRSRIRVEVVFEAGARPR